MEVGKGFHQVIMVMLSLLFKEEEERETRRKRKGGLWVGMERKGKKRENEKGNSNTL